MTQRIELHILGRGFEEICESAPKFYNKFMENKIYIQETHLKYNVESGTANMEMIVRSDVNLASIDPDRLGDMLAEVGKRYASAYVWLHDSSKDKPYIHLRR